MKHHSTTHEPGQQVLDHETIKKRRIQKVLEEQEKIKKLQQGQILKTSNVRKVPQMSLQRNPGLQTPGASALMPQRPMQFSQVPKGCPPLPLASNPSAKNLQNMFGDAGAPTVDLWTLYQPVVLIKRTDILNRKKPYTCGKCGQSFLSKASLVSHHNLHVTDKVSGCVGCGLLLSSKKLVPRFHSCNSTNNQTKFRLVTARPLDFKLPSGPATQRNAVPQKPLINLQLENKSPFVIARGGQAPNITSISALKTQNIQTYRKVPHVTSPLQSKNQNPTASKPAGFVLPAMSQTFKLTRINSAADIFCDTEDLFLNESQCRVCNVLFETPQLLQRHKCVKAQEFMARHMKDRKIPQKTCSVTPATDDFAHLNGERKLGFQTNQLRAASLDKDGAPGNGELDGEDEDDCYIVESGPGNPAEVIYQVTSSVPIKT